MADQYNAELARARARGVQSVSVSGLEHLKTILEQNPVVKWVVTADNKLQIVPKRVGGTEISHAVAAENQAVRAAAAVSQGHLDLSVEQELAFFQAAHPARWLLESSVSKRHQPLGRSLPTFRLLPTV